jgi:site-specific DNA-cytosine methylase
MGHDLTFVDLFCGIGGMRLGFEQAGCRCVFSSDWDKYAQQTYAANFGETPVGNIRKHLVRNDKGGTMEAILETLSGDLGYHVYEARVLDARHTSCHSKSTTIDVTVVTACSPSSV